MEINFETLRSIQAMMPPADPARFAVAHPSVIDLWETAGGDFKVIPPSETFGPLTFAGYPLRIDALLPEDEVQFRDKDGAIVRVIKLGGNTE